MAFWVRRVKCRTASRPDATRSGRIARPQNKKAAQKAARARPRLGEEPHPPDIARRLLRRRRYAAKPRPAKPNSNMAQVDGSGTEMAEPETANILFLARISSLI